MRSIAPRGPRVLQRALEAATAAGVVLVCALDASRWHAPLGTLVDDSFPPWIRIALRISATVGALLLLVPNTAGYTAIVLFGLLAFLTVWRMGGGGSILELLAQLLVLIALARIGRGRLAHRRVNQAGESTPASD